MAGRIPKCSTAGRGVFQIARDTPSNTSDDRAPANSCSPRRGCANRRAEVSLCICGPRGWRRSREIFAGTNQTLFVSTTSYLCHHSGCVTTKFSLCHYQILPFPLPRSPVGRCHKQFHCARYQLTTFRGIMVSASLSVRFCSSQKSLVVSTARPYRFVFRRNVPAPKPFKFEILGEILVLSFDSENRYFYRYMLWKSLHRVAERQ